MKSIKRGPSSIIILSTLLLLVVLGCGSDEIVDPTTQNGLVVVQPFPEELDAPWTLVTSFGDLIEGDGRLQLRAMPIGRYALSWGKVEGYRAPAGMQGDLGLGETLTFFGEYEELGSGTIDIDVSPDGFEGGWTIVSEDGAFLVGSGDTTLTDMVTGDYTVSWAPVAGYATPQPNPVTTNLQNGSTISFVGAYQQVFDGGAGDLRIDPLSDGTPVPAPWSITGPGGFADSGVGAKSYSGRAVGTYSITWGALDGYATPAAASTTVEADEAAQLIGDYRRYTASIAVDVSPNGLAAPWSVYDEFGPVGDGTGDGMVDDLPLGTYTFTWGYADGWDTPQPRQFEVVLGTDGATAGVSGTYVESDGTSPTGTLRLTTNPSGLAAPWNLSGPDGFTESGMGAETLSGVPVGSYDVTWGDVSGYGTPSAATGVVTDGGTTVLEGDYDARVGSIQVQPSPQGVYFPWTVRGPQDYVRNGFGSATLEDLLVGTYTITWGNVDRYVTPEPETRTLNVNQTLTFAAAFVLATGVIDIEPTPAGIDAPWTLEGPQGTQSGVGALRIDDAPVGSYSIAWGGVDGYVAPAPDARNVNQGQTVVFEGEYAEQGSTVATLTIDPEPDSIDAQWTLTPFAGQIQIGYGDATLELEPGQYNVRFEGAQGWLVPSPQSVDVTLTAGQILVVTGNYTVDPDLGSGDTGTVVVAVTPNQASWSMTGPDGFAESGTGDATFDDAAIGTYTITWDDLDGYLTPSPNPANLTLTSDQTITFASNYGTVGSPSVSGVDGPLAAGQSIVISGENFGSKVPAAPLLWDSFENGNVGQAIQNVAAEVGDWDSGGWSHNVYYGDARAYGGGSGSAEHRYTPSEWSSDLAKNGNFPVVYMDWKTYFPSSNLSVSNYKPFRLYGANDAKQWYAGYGCGYAVASFVGLGTEWPGPWNSSLEDRWVHYQHALKEASSRSASDGWVWSRRDCDPFGHNGTNLATRSEVDANFDQIRIGHYHDVGERDGCDPSNSSRMWTDNVYIDTTWARVEIGDRASYEACTQREIQIPTAWNGGEVTVDVNLGRFSSGSSVYVFVVDENGNISPGYGPIVVQ